MVENIRLKKHPIVAIAGVMTMAKCISWQLG
jgi:hypothetical protein